MGTLICGVLIMQNKLRKNILPKIEFLIDVLNWRSRRKLTSVNIRMFNSYLAISLGLMYEVLMYN